MSPRCSTSWEMTRELAPRHANDVCRLFSESTQDECEEGVTLSKYSGRKPSRNMAL